MDRDLRRSVYISGFVHVALIIAAIITLPAPLLQSSDDDDVTVTIGPTASKESPVKGAGQATVVGDLHHSDAISQNKPPPKIISAPPPPPPPPQESKAPVSTTQTTQSGTPPPPLPSDQPSTIPPPPPVPPKPHASVTPAKEKPAVKPPTSIKSPTHQTKEVKTPQPLSQSVLNTLLNLKAIQKQKQAPTTPYVPDANEAPVVGGSTNSTSNNALSGPDRAAIGAHVRPCWGIDAQAEGVQSFSVLLTVTTDGTGTVREAEVSPQNTGDMSNPIYYAYTQRAIAALMNATCATLPLPSNMLGSNQTFSFVFTP